MSLFARRFITSFCVTLAAVVLLAGILEVTLSGDRMVGREREFITREDMELLNKLAQCADNAFAMFFPKVRIFFRLLLSGASYLGRAWSL